MRLRLKEDPKEWRKFAGVAALAGGLVSWLLWRKSVFTGTAFCAALVAFSAWFVGSLVRPRWYRPFYRAAMTFSFHAGQVVGRVLLVVVFFFVVLPVGLGLRLFGKDLLKLRRNTSAPTYWQPANFSERFDRLF